MVDTGALGGVLSDVGLGLMQGLMGPSWDEEKAARERKAREQETDIKLKEAQALYYARRQDAGRANRLYKVGNNLVQWNEEMGKPEVLYEGPAKEPNEAERLRTAARAHMERIIGQKYGLPSVPIEAWKTEDWDEPALDPLRDFAGVGRSPLITTPGGPGAETRPKRDIGGYGGRPEAPRPPASGPPEAGQPPPTGQPPPEAPKAPPVTKPSPPSTKPSGGAKAPAGPQAAAPDPVMLKHYEGRFPHLPIEQADEQWALLTGPGMQTKPENLAAFLAAYKKVYGKLPPGVEETGMTTGGAAQPQPGGTPPPTGETPAATPPDDRTTRTTLPDITPPPKPVTWGRERGTPLNNEQLTAQAYEAWQRQKEYEVAVQGKLMAERQLLKDEEARDLRALGGEPTPELKEMTLRLNAEGRVKGKDFTKLTPAEQKLVIDTKNLPKRRKEEQSWKKLAEPHMAELQALQTAQDLTTMILPLIENGTVGLRGKISGVGTWVRSHLMRNRFYTEAEAKLKATPEGRATLAKLGNAAIQAQVAADVETNDPAVRADMSKIATRARLQTLSSVLMYAHALAQKRITGGSQRGLIKPDMDEAHKLFDPDLFFTAPEQLMANLQTLQGVIQAARGRVEENVRSYHFVPAVGTTGTRTWKYQPDEVDEEAPAPAAPTAESPEARLQRGPRRP